MAELSAVNSSESKHRLDSMKLIGRKHLKQSEYKKILIVDDISDIAFGLCLELESDPIMQVYSYDNPVTALLDFKPNFYDLLLIDINMPLMDGFQLAHKLLQRDINVRICFMTSGEINMTAAREVHPLKCIGCFIKKPITAEQLLRRIRAELE
ncbi:MAG TPA: response regulator [Nitrososphaeraceae archaeon]|jgi:DNA-binding response OmpR family regulator|nr:response regulator [Nitrososphaeraceae archaeon]